MQLPDEAIAFHAHGALATASESWDLRAELQAKHYLAPNRLKAMSQALTQARSQIAAERELTTAPAGQGPIEAGFIDLPQQTLDQFRRAAESSLLGRILTRAQRLRNEVGRVVILGIGGSSLAARALFQALTHAHHNDLPAHDRLGVPRIDFDGDHLDNDALHDLLDLFEKCCVDPDLPEERWGAILISKSGDSLETAIAHRILRAELSRFYGSGSPWRRGLLVPITGSSGPLRTLLHADGFKDEEILPWPDNVGGRFAIFTAAGLLPAAVMGLDVRALLLGAAAMTRRFLEEPFERNPVLQFAAVNYLFHEELGKPIRVLASWARQLEGVGAWHSQLIADSLGKQGRGPTPLALALPRDLHARGQQLFEGPRDKFLIHLSVQNPRHPAVAVGMADRNEDDLNQHARRTLPELLDATRQAVRQAEADTLRPSVEIQLPMLSEHTLGQLLQMLMLATVVEGRLMGINPYGQPAVEAHKRHTRHLLKARNNPGS